MLQAKRRIKMLERTPDYERDSEWEVLMERLKTELKSCEDLKEDKLETKTTTTTDVTDPQIRRRLKILERTPEYERDADWHSQMAELMKPVESVGSQKLESQSSSQTDIKPSAELKVESTLIDSSKQQNSSTDMLTVLLHTFTFTNDVNSRTEYGFTSLAGSLLLSVIAPVHLFSSIFMFSHIILFITLLSRVGYQHFLWYLTVYVLRDYIPNLAIVLSASALLTTPVVVLLAALFGLVSLYRSGKKLKAT